MSFPNPPRWPAWILLLAILGHVVPSLTSGRAGACACGMTVGCCCTLAKARHAMAPGASCSLGRASDRCSLRKPQEAAVQARNDAPLAGNVAGAVLGRLAPPTPRSLRLVSRNEVGGSALLPEPLTPPPRPS